MCNFDIVCHAQQSKISRLQDEVAQYKKDVEQKDAEVVNAVEQHTEVNFECT